MDDEFITSPRPAKTMTLCIPRRRGWSVAWSVLITTISAYLHRTSSVTFEVVDE